MPCDIGGVLDRLEAQADHNALARDAAKVIRRLTEQISTVETDLIEAEFSRYAHAAEIDRMNDVRRSWHDNRTKMKAARR